MKAFPNSLITRDLMIADMIARREADEFIARAYGEVKDGEFKGSAVGCSIHTINRVLGTNHSFDDHDALAKEIGVPVDLMQLQERIFTNLSAKNRVFWPERFYQSIPAGSDQFDTPRRINIRVLREIALPAITGDEWGCRNAVTGMADALESGDAERINAARVTAVRAVDAADATGPNVAYAAYAAYAARAARAADVARAAVDAAYAADADAGAARAAAWRQIAAIACEEMSRAPQAQGPKNEK